ncbi:histone-lysine N-methyltransferase ATX1 [Quillaja saponaria]|uniref:Histone-lysine N-methyltransferase ATX1 n=1 Tax=Quillaja saponaria TaxID=32244 RepID=A0AAD7QID5_QUISA|nr:histone-lysine N-methyltransferase ATX1 [Quillaja saponaria]
MDARFHGLPPLKRFRLMQQQQALEEAAVFSSPLPAKKRKETRESIFLPEPTLPASASSYSLPAKKRVWALQPDFFCDQIVSPIDLNVKYEPPFEEEIKAADDEDNKRSAGVDSDSQSTENTQEILDKKEDEDEDDGILCAICRSTDGDPTDPIVLCDGCDLMVHATCYGSPLVKGIPEGDWFCNQCLVLASSKTESKGKTFSCCLCPIKEGAMKTTMEGHWAHIVCALLVPEVFFTDPEGREGIDCSKVPKRRWEEKCYVCNHTSGCAIVCSELKCPLAFHVTCGLKEDLCFELREGRKKGTIVAGFCKTHTELWEKQQQTGKFKIVAREDQK